MGNDLKKTSTLFAVGSHLLKVRPTVLIAFIKNILSVERRKVSTSMGYFLLDPFTHLGQSLYNGTFEEDSQKLIFELLEDGDTFIDVGANEGFFSIFASKIVGTQGHAYAIEPQKRLISVIDRNLEINGISNVDVINCAVGNNENEELEMWLSPTTFSGSSSLVNKYFLAQKQTVQSKTLNQIFGEFDILSADFVKVDVEGYEPEVIEGAIPLLNQNRIKYLYVDYHTTILEARDIALEDIHNHIVAQGYDFQSEANYPEGGYALYRARRPV